MLSVGLAELSLVVVVALIVIGPKHLPTLARTAGKWWKKWQKLKDKISQEINE